MKSMAGFSMVSTIVSLGIVGIVAMILSDSATTSLKTQGRVNSLSEIEAIKRTLYKRLDCSRTLDSGLMQPALNCSDYSTVTLKRRGGASLVSSSGKIGRWQVKAGCENNEIIVKLSRPGKDPLSGKKWNDMFFATDDLFKGTSDFCREYFDASYKRYRYYSLPQLVQYKGGAACGGGWQGCFESCNKIISGDTTAQFMNANTACHRACVAKNWVGGAFVECNGSNPNEAQHYVGCFCSM